MLEIVLVHVGVHRDPFAVEDLVVLRAGQRGQEKEFEDVERQLLLDDLDVAGDRFGRVGRKTGDHARPGHNLLLSPGLQHHSVFPDLVLPLLRALEQFGIDALEPDEDLVAAGPRRLLDEARNPMAESVDLKDELDRNALVGSQIDQPVEDRLPVAVAGEIVVGDEIVVDALGEVGAHNRLDVVGGAEARLAPLHVDDGAETALKRAAAPGVEAGVMTDDPPDHFLGQHGYRRGLHAGHVMEVVVEGLRLAGVDVAEKIRHPPLALARVEGHAERLRLFQIRRKLGKHRDAARDVEAADHDGHV